MIHNSHSKYITFLSLSLYFSYFPDSYLTLSPLQGSAIPLEAYQHPALDAEEELDPMKGLDPPVDPAAIWLPNSSVCLTWEPPLLVDGRNQGVMVTGYKVGN